MVNAVQMIFMVYVVMVVNSIQIMSWSVWYNRWSVLMHAYTCGCAELHVPCMFIIGINSNSHVQYISRSAKSAGTRIAVVNLQVAIASYKQEAASSNMCLAL